MPRRRAGLLLALAVAAAAAGCAIDLKARGDSAPPAAPPRSEVARQVGALGPAGRMDLAQRTALIRRLGAQGSSDAVHRHLAAMAEAGDVELIAGNQVRLLIDGPATFEAMFRAIEQARHSILVESYIVDDAAIARRLADLLAAKRAAGVPVLMIYDDLGSLGTGAGYFEALERAGVATCAFNPLNPLSGRGYGDITHRDHRKIVVVDGETAFTGGINISAVYASSSPARKRKLPLAGDAAAGWRDTHVQIRGPAARVLDAIVRDTWLRQGCDGALPAPRDAVSPAAAGREVMRILPSRPGPGVDPFYALLLGAIDTAQLSVHLTMAYFAPGDEMVAALCSAARRGVDVQLVLPSRSDFTPVLQAGRSYYARLLAAGVVIHELQDAVLHAKTAVVDGVVSTVGSSNLDWRSIAVNNEVNAVVIGDEFGLAMTRMFEQDVHDSRTIRADDWSRRGLWQRAAEVLARAFERWW